MTSPWSLAIPAPPQACNHILGAWQLTYIYDDSRSHDCNLPWSLPKSKLVGEAGKVTSCLGLSHLPTSHSPSALVLHLPGYSQTLLSLVELVLHLPSHSHTLEHSPQVFCYTLAMITWQLTHLSYLAAAISSPVVHFHHICTLSEPYCTCAASPWLPIHSISHWKQTLTCLGLAKRYLLNKPQSSFRDCMDCHHALHYDSIAY